MMLHLLLQIALFVTGGALLMIGIRAASFHGYAVSKLDTCDNLLEAEVLTRIQGRKAVECVLSTIAGAVLWALI